jgi:putative toxin-antitoxin system antitoxin component (TIGR02293 family)
MTALRQNLHSEAKEMAHFLGLKSWETVDDLALVQKVKKGFPASTIKNIVKKVDPYDRFLKPTDIIPRATYHRHMKHNQALTRNQSERVLALAKVFLEVLRQYHDDTELAAQFLLRKHPLLGGRSPMELAKESTAGADLVLKHLARAEASVAV